MTDRYQFVELENKLPSSGLKKYHLKKGEVVFLTIEIAHTDSTEQFLLKILKGLDMYDFAEALL